MCFMCVIVLKEIVKGKITGNRELESFAKKENNQVMKGRGRE